MDFETTYSVLQWLKMKEYFFDEHVHVNECNILTYSTCFTLHKLLDSVYIIQNYYSYIIQNPIYETYVVVKN